MASRQFPFQHYLLSIIFSLFVSLNICLSQTPSPTHPLSYSSYHNCLVRFSSINTTFNVCPLKLPMGLGQSAYYHIQDTRWDTTSSRYEYHFNIGAPILSEDHACNNLSTSLEHGYCTNITNAGQCAIELTPINGVAYAYQLWFNDTSGEVKDCWHLSNEYGGPPEWSLVYADNPTDGVMLTYINGDFGCGENREFHIKFLCENEFLFIPTKQHLHEYTSCHYTVEIPSIYGCPVECKVYDNQLCNGQGLCGYDYTNTKPRCFCYDKYEGDDCSIYAPNENITTPSKDLPISTPNSIIHTFHHINPDNDTITNVTYDLTPMGLNGDAYKIRDADPGDSRQKYIYYISIFQPIDLSNLPCNWTNNITNDHAPCSNIDSNGNCLSFDSNGTDYTQLLYAVQYDSEEGYCYILGTTAKWLLYDKIDDPARGITLQYDMGTWCHDKNREFSISIVCPDDNEEFTTPPINEIAFVEEDTEEFCSYSVIIENTIGCPYQCRTNDINNNNEYSVCSTHGLCAADPNAEFVRCLCDDGWIGIECDEIISPKPSLSPTLQPTNNPSQPPTITPTMSPTIPPTTSPTDIPSKAPSNIPTVRPTRYPTLGVQIQNITTIIIDTEPNENGRGGITTLTIIIIILILVIFGIIVLVYFGYNKYKQKMSIMEMKLNDYEQFNENDENIHDITTDNKGKQQFTQINTNDINDADDDDA